MTFNLPSPLEKLSGFATKSDFELFVKRDDLIHPTISGNKYRKLKYNLTDVDHGVVTFGGAFSNHIHAFAAATKMFGIHGVGIIRGETSYSTNPTLSFAKDCGLDLHFVSREEYRLKEESKVVSNILKKYKNYKLIPEGGSNQLALKGTEELFYELDDQERMDYIICAAGTGGTAAGILRGIHNSHSKTKLIVISALKGDFLEKDILNLAQLEASDRLMVLNDYHRGGYAKTDVDLINFINKFKRNQGILLDPIYNGKVVMALEKLLSTSFFKQRSKICWIHTGGLQGVDAYNYMSRDKKPLISKN